MSHHTVDDFKGNDGLLIQCIDSLLAMDAKGILVPHGIGGHARTLLKASKAALEQAEQSVPPKPDYSVTQLQRAAWQAAQSVPVVGKPVAWAVPVATQTGQPDTKLSWTESGARIGVKVGESTPLYLKPVNSISAAELERLRKDAERYHYLRKMGLREAGFKENMITFSAQDEAIDAAIAAEENSHE